MTLIQVEPDAQQKLAILGAEAADEATDVPAGNSAGQTTRLFKLLQTNACRCG